MDVGETNTEQTYCDKIHPLTPKPFTFVKPNGQRIFANF